MTTQRRINRQKGVSLLLGTAAMIVIVPMVGLAIDVGVIYSLKARLQAAVDGAALAGARSLILGATTAAQADSAKQTSANWFFANFPVGAWGTNNTVMDRTDTHVHVYDDATNPNLRHVDVMATTNTPTYFMQFLGFNAASLKAFGYASRRDVVAMLVLDRSGSMNTTSSCGDLRSAAKLFNSQFASGRDYIGLVSFSDGTYVHSAPTRNFRTVLGYDDGVTTATGQIDNITCGGGTSTAQALSIGYNELYKMHLPGALNIMLLETDGLPNSLVMNWWDSAATTAGFTSQSTITNGCQDTAGKTKAQNGWGSAGVVRAWTPGYSMNTDSLGHAVTGFMSDIPAGIIGGMPSSDPGQSAAFYALANPWHTSSYSGMGLSSNNSTLTTGANCLFTSSWNNVHDFAWLPPTDVFGNSLNPSTNPYATVTMAGSKVSFPGDTTGWTNYHNAALNATIDSAYRIRTNATLPATVFVIGLGGNAAGAPDYTLMRRIANDDSADIFNSPGLYNNCASTTNCVNYSSQPSGTFVYSTDKNDLRRAFLEISSQVLRLSR